MEQQPAIVSMMNVSPDFLQKQLSLHHEKEAFQAAFSTNEDKQARNKELWRPWVEKYWQLLVSMEEKRMDGFSVAPLSTDECKHLDHVSFVQRVSSRWETMRLSNPKVVLRNYLAQEAILRAEEDGDFREIRTLLDVLSNPFDEEDDQDDKGDGSRNYEQNPPEWTADICVTCSS